MGVIDTGSPYRCCRHCSPASHTGLPVAARNKQRTRTEQNGTRVVENWSTNRRCMIAPPFSDLCASVPSPIHFRFNLTTYFAVQTHCHHTPLYAIAAGKYVPKSAAATPPRRYASGRKHGYLTRRSTKNWHSSEQDVPWNRRRVLVILFSYALCFWCTSLGTCASIKKAESVTAASTSDGNKARFE